MRRSDKKIANRKLVRFDWAMKYILRKENTDFIYYRSTELVGLHTRKPLVLHEAVANGEKKSVVTSKDVFPEYYMIYVEKFQDMINEAIDEWVYFFKYGEIKEEFTSPGILLAAKKLDYLTMNEEERRAYDGYLAYLGQEMDILDSAKEEGINIGVEKGISIGVEKGISIGVEKGIMIVARKMYLAGDSIEKISSLTGISVEELKKEIENKEDDC